MRQRNVIGSGRWIVQWPCRWLCIVIGASWALLQAEPRIYREKLEPVWFDEGNQFWYRREHTGGGWEFIRVRAAEGRRETAFDTEKLAASLAAITGEAVQANRLELEALEFGISSDTLRFRWQGQAYTFNLSDYLGRIEEPSESESIEERNDVEENDSSQATRSTRDRREVVRGRTPRDGGRGVRSPDGRWEVRVHGDNLLLRHVRSGKESLVTHDGNPTSSYRRNADRRRLVEMNYDAQDPETPVPEVLWAPDSRRFIAMRYFAGTNRKVELIASSPSDQLQPRSESYPYLKPGDTLPLRKPRLFVVDDSENPSALEVSLSETLYANPWSIGSTRWDRDSKRFTFVFNQRGHQVLRVLALEGQSGKVTPLIEESSDTFIHYSGKFFYEYLEDTQEILWMSEKSGWNHIYLHDARTGQLKNAVTQGNWVVQAVEHVDREKRRLRLRVGGLYPDQDPYFAHFIEVGFDGSRQVRLTEGNGDHTLQFSPDRRFLIDTWSRVDFPPVHELRRAEDGTLLCVLEQSDATELLESGWYPPEPFVSKGRDGKTDIYGILHRPRGFDPNKKYPVIENIYAGPHSFFVPKSFRSTYGWERLANEGFIIVKIDGMGTSGRSKAFHDVCWKNIADAGFPDRKLWMQAAAEKYPWMDLSRVGIYGGSAGGQNAMGALLWHGDFYHAAAADCGCHDNRMDKIWWNEQWMGWPVDTHYEEQSNRVQAHRLQGKLLLTVGELDKNVDPASTYQVVDALIRADKEFEFILFPGRGHGAGGSAYGDRRRIDFFKRHLLPEGQ